jgi:hypothetical protein
MEIPFDEYQRGFRNTGSFCGIRGHSDIPDLLAGDGSESISAMQRLLLPVYSSGTPVQSNVDAALFEMGR